MGGNVAEWIQDLYAISPAASGAGPAKDPLGPESGEFHVIRGSSFLHSTVSELRLTYRDYGKEPRPDLGFRIARYTE
jgi:formylglycine-generating enzyme required for sulfatase activity